MDIQIFQNDQFGQIRGLNIEGETWLMATDVARRLGYTNPQKAIRDHVDEEDKRTERFVHPSGGAQQTMMINESGLYSLILSSRRTNSLRLSAQRCSLTPPLSTVCRCRCTLANIRMRKVTCVIVMRYGS